MLCQKQLGPVYGVESLEYNSGSTFGGKPVSISLVSNNIDAIKAAKEELKVQLRAMPQLKDVSDNDPQGIKEIRLALKDNAYLLGFNLNSVMRQVRAGFFWSVGATLSARTRRNTSMGTI